MNVTIFRDAYLNRISTIKQSEEINLYVVNALRFVIQNVFLNIANTFVFTVSSSGGPVEFWLLDTMSKLFATWSFIAVQLIVSDSKHPYIDVPGKRYCNMIMVDSLKSLEKAKIAEYNKNGDNLEYYYIFLQIRDIHIAEESEKILKYCFHNYWINCNVMIQTSKGEVLVYTYFPFNENGCFQTKPVLINRFIKNKFENEVMFPNKLKNLYGCSLKLSTWETSPFVINSSNNKFPVIQISGFEILTLITISQYMNFSLKIEWIDIETYSKNISPENEPLMKLKTYDTNFTMGYFRRTADRDKIATPSYVTYYIPLAAIILRKQANHESMGILTFPFDLITWILICVVYTVIGLFNFFQKRTSSGGVFQVFEVILGMPINTIPQWSSSRISLMTTILSSLILRSIYQSLLFYLYRTNFYQVPPITLNGLVEDGYKAVTTELTQRFLIYVPQIADKTLPLIVINNTNELFPLRYLKLYRNESLVAITIIEFAVRYVDEEMDVGDALQILPINVKDQQVCFYLPKHSYFIEIFDLYIIRFHQAGLLIKWREWNLMNYTVTHRISSSKYESNLIVNLNQLIGFMFLIMFLLFISIVVFVLELMSTKCKWLRKLF
ncbi:uncharacterized protein ACRADG_007847 [Cochliomyia hominivorax]